MKRFDVSDLNNIKAGDVVSVTGCGGKTTLIETMAARLSAKYRVGIATTVRIAFPPAGSFCRIFIGHCDEKIEAAGIYYFADEIISDSAKPDSVFQNETGAVDFTGRSNTVRKLHGLSESLKRQALEQTDILLIEADGSAGRPVKVWRDDEPVIVPETTMTIGVCAPECIGLPVSEHTVHRLGLYRARYGSVPDRITDGMFHKMYESPDGMFAHGRGELLLWENCASVAAIVLASGFSRRMGEDKLMMDVFGTPMIGRVLESVGAVSFLEKYVVTNKPDIAVLAIKGGFTAVENMRACEGQSASVVCGTAAAIKRAPAGLMFFMGDMPFVTAGIIRKLKTAFAAFGGRKIIVPAYPSQKGWRRGNPVIFPAGYAGELLALTGDIGGRAVIKAHEDDVFYVRFSEKQNGLDIDRPEDFVPDKIKTYFCHGGKYED